MSRSRFILRIVIILGCAVLGASLGVCFQALRITGKPQEFRSMAKLVAAYPRKDFQYEFSDNNDFYGTVIETIESADMKRRALERVRALHPELKEIEVQVRVTMTRGSGVFNVLAVGDEPRYTKIFLDALLEEFISFRQSMREQSQNKVVQAFLLGIVNAQKRMEELFAAVEKARSKVESLPARAEQERVVARLSSFRNQWDDLQLELKALPAGEPSRAALEAKAKLVEQEIQALETSIDTFEQAGVEFRTASEKHDQAKLAYQKMFDSVQQFQSGWSSCQGDYVAIQERASAAAEQVEDWQLPIAIGAGGGGLAGALVGFLISLALSGAPGPSPVPHKQN